MTEGGEEPVEKYYIVLNVKCEDANMNEMQAFKLSRQLICDVYRNVNICCDMLC
jgi:hypothetical protein